MNVTRLAGWILLLFAVAHFGVSLADFGPEYAAAGAIGENAEKYGLDTSGTNLRFKLGLEFLVDILLAGVLAIAGWWLTTSEVTQNIWIILIGVFVIFSIVVRATPIVPLNVAKLSPGCAFYGAQIQLGVSKDVTFNGPVRQYVVITKKQAVRTVMTAQQQGQASEMVVLDLTNKAAANQYQKCALPLTIDGNVMGTAAVAKGKDLVIVPLIKAKSAQSGLPQKK